MERIVRSQVTELVKGGYILPHVCQDLEVDIAMTHHWHMSQKTRCKLWTREWASILVLLDFSKAFDCNELAVQNLCYYGILISSCKWFRTFLTGREQYVEVQSEQERY